MDYRRLAELSEEFTSLWDRLQAFYLDSVVGFHYVLERVATNQQQARMFVRGSELDSEAFQDTRMFNYDGIFPDGFCTSGIHRASQGEVKNRNTQGGKNVNTLGQVCLTSFYDFWNDYLRIEYVKAKGLYDPNDRDRCLREHASHDLWGDLYYLRTAIVHHQGIATNDVKKCKLLKWFLPGDEIALSSDNMRTILLGLLLYRNELYKEQFPPTTLLIAE